MSIFIRSDSLPLPSQNAPARSVDTQPSESIMIRESDIPIEIGGWRVVSMGVSYGSTSQSCSHRLLTGKISKISEGGCSFFDGDWISPQSHCQNFLKNIFPYRQGGAPHLCTCLPH